MAFLRKLKVLVFIFVFVALFAGAFSIMSAEEAEARYACCIWVMYCTVNPPIYCWCECIPTPCP